MPPKAVSKKRAKPGPEVDYSDELDAQLAQIDLYVDTLKSSLEEMVHAPLDEIKRMINKHMIKLPSAVANMKMSDFLREHGGSITAANEHKKNAARLARTTAKPILGTSKFGNVLSTVAKPALAKPIAPSALNAAMDGHESVTAGRLSLVASVPVPVAPPVVGSSHTSASLSSMPLQTPMNAGARSRIGAAALQIAAKTPAMGQMKSTLLLPQALGAQTPGGPLNAYLPTTPAHGAGGDAGAKLPRQRRRNEVVFHVAVPVSTNLSPLADDEGASSSAGSQEAALPAALISAPFAGAGPIVAVAVETATGTQAVRIDDASALDSLNEDGARQMQDMLEKLQAQVSATQAILKAKQAELADAAKRA